MSHVTYEWVMSHITHMSESCHTYERVTSHTNESHHTRKGGRTTQTEMLRNLDGLCHTCEWVMLRIKESCYIWVSHITRMTQSCDTYTWVMPHTWRSRVKDEQRIQRCCGIFMGHVTHVNESYHTHEGVMAHITMSHVTHTKESLHRWATQNKKEGV